MTFSDQSKHVIWARRTSI